MKLKRLNRLQYAVTMIVAGILLIAYPILISQADFGNDVGVIILVPFFILLFIYFGAIVLRLLDSGKSPLLLALCFVFPIYIIILGFAPSKNEELID